jgi:hypothetical protein
MAKRKWASARILSTTLKEINAYVDAKNKEGIQPETFGSVVHKAWQAFEAMRASGYHVCPECGLMLTKGQSCRCKAGER